MVSEMKSAYGLCIADQETSSRSEEIKKFLAQVSEQETVWGISRIGDGIQKVSEMIWEAQTALRAA